MNVFIAFAHDIWKDQVNIKLDVFIILGCREGLKNYFEPF